MSRTKGAKDRKLRKMSPASLANMPTKTLGMESASLRVYAATGVVQWFARMEPRQRGAVITTAMKGDRDES